MSDLEEKLEGILSNPKAMEQIMSLAQSLGKSSAQSHPPISTPAPDPEPAGSPTNASAGGNLLDALSQVDPRLISGAVQLMSQYHNNDDNRVALLSALRPFVKEKRWAKVDKAIQIARLSHVIRVAIDTFKKGGSGHV